MRVSVGLVVSAVLFVAVFAAVADAAAPKFYWTETFAEKRVVQTARVPCKRVRGAQGCVLADATAEAASYKQNLEFCTAITEPARSFACLNSMIGLRSPDWNLDVIQRGFPVALAECVGGNPDKSGFRFSQLRCTITVKDRTRSNQRREVSGRIVVYVTGRSTFRWAMIP